MDNNISEAVGRLERTIARQEAEITRLKARDTDSQELLHGAGFHQSCSQCGTGLLFSARAMGDGLCHTCGHKDRAAAEAENNKLRAKVRLTERDRDIQVGHMKDKLAVAVAEVGRMNVAINCCTEERKHWKAKAEAQIPNLQTVVAERDTEIARLKAQLQVNAQAGQNIIDSENRMFQEKEQYKLDLTRAQAKIAALEAVIDERGAARDGLVALHRMNSKTPAEYDVLLAACRERGEVTQSGDDVIVRGLKNPTLEQLRIIARTDSNGVPRATSPKPSDTGPFGGYGGMDPKQPGPHAWRPCDSDLTDAVRFRNRGDHGVKCMARRDATAYTATVWQYGNYETRFTMDERLFDLLFELDSEKE